MKKYFYKLLIAYDGTDFSGWQMQREDRTITSVLCSAFHKVFKSSSTLVGASRTDAGVHAFGQVASLRVGLDLEPCQMRRAWNNALPKSIVIRHIERVDHSFHPLKKVKQKTYYYHLFYKRPSPFIARFGWYHHYVQRVSWEKFFSGLSLYQGTHDFTSFCKRKDDESAVRTIDMIKGEMLRMFGCYRVIIQGKGFAHFQIRRMIGYAFDVARQDDLSVDYIRDLLNNPSRRQRLLKADASGLVLRKVMYDE